MKEGWYERTFKATLQNDIEIAVAAKRFLSLDIDEVGAIAYSVKPLNSDATITYTPYLDSGIKNEDANWEEKFWETIQVKEENKQAFIVHTRFFMAIL